MTEITATEIHLTDPDGEVILATAADLAEGEDDLAGEIAEQAIADAGLDYAVRDDGPFAQVLGGNGFAHVIIVNVAPIA